MPNNILKELFFCQKSYGNTTRLKILNTIKKNSVPFQAISGDLLLGQTRAQRQHPFHTHFFSNFFDYFFCSIFLPTTFFSTFFMIFFYLHFFSTFFIFFYPHFFFNFLPLFLTTIFFSIFFEVLFFTPTYFFSTCLFF